MLRRGTFARSHRRIRLQAASEHGAALLVALISTMLIGALGLALVLTTGTETAISSNFGNDIEALYAAEAALERALSDLGASPDWNLVLSGIVTSSFIDGPSAGRRTLADGRALDLTEATNLLNCGKVTTCSQGEMDAQSPGRHSGANNARWQLYAHGPLAALPSPSGGRAIDSSMYLAVWVADDQMEDDGNPLVDGEVGLSRGAGVVAVRAEAFGVGSSHKAIRSDRACEEGSGTAGGVRVSSRGE